MKTVVTKKKSKKIPPVRYKRPIPKGMVEVPTKMDKEIKTGMLLEFTYGTKKKEGQVGGWKNDPRPVLLVIYDDKINGYIEGLNTNYLSDYYIKKLKILMERFPGLDSRHLYRILKRTAKYAIKKGYRKYLRLSLKSCRLYLYENEIANELIEDVKEDIHNRRPSKRRPARKVAKDKKKKQSKKKPSSRKRK